MTADQKTSFICDWLPGSVSWLCGHPRECPQCPHSLLLASRLSDFQQNGSTHGNHRLCDKSPAYPNTGKAQRRGKEIFTDLLLSNKHVAVSLALRQSGENHGREVTQLESQRSGQADLRCWAEAGATTAEPGAAAGSWEAARRCKPTGERLIQVFKRPNVFELSLPLKPCVWSGNFPLVYSFLSLLLCYRIIWFHEGPEGKTSASCREGCYRDILLSRKNNFLILFSTTSKEHEKSLETRLFLPKRPVQFPKQRSLDSSHKLCKQGWVSWAYLNPTEPFQGLPVINC